MADPPPQEGAAGRGGGRRRPELQTLFEIFRVDHWGEFWWVVVGLSGQALFSMRFLVQWIMSERAKRSVMPIAFWYFSLAGGVVLLSYAIYRRDPVFMLGQGTGLIIYAPQPLADPCRQAHRLTPGPSGSASPGSPSSPSGGWRCCRSTPATSSSTRRSTGSGAASSPGATIPSRR